MVSEKVIVAIIILAILLSVVSIVVTVSSVNSKQIPKIQVNEAPGIPDSDKGQVSLIVNKRPEAP